MAGRHPTWNPIGVGDADAWLEPVEVASKDRIVLPAAVRRRLGWGSARGVVPLLAVIGADGSVELLPWESKGIAEVTRVMDALAKIDGDAREFAVLAAMDRYLKVGLGNDGRIQLPGALAVHLSVAEGDFVRVALSRGRLWLWPERAWEAARADRLARLEKLLSST